jgi:hypothetical protein
MPEVGFIAAFDVDPFLCARQTLLPHISATLICDNPSLVTIPTPRGPHWARLCAALLLMSAGTCGPALR